MPNYKLTHDTWLDREVAKCRPVLIENMDPAKVYTPADIQHLLEASGLFYNTADIQAIGVALIAEGVIEAA